MATLVVLQGCVGHAAMNALERWTEHAFIVAQPIDANHFRVVIELERKRGAFNPLGGHGSGQVTSSIAVELWRLSVSERGVETRKEDALSFESEEEIARWRDRKTVELDMARGRISLPQPSEPGRTGFAYSRNLRWDRTRQIVLGTVHGRECAVRLPPAPAAPDAWRSFVASDGGDAFMLVDHVGRARRAVILSACDAGKPPHPVEFPMEEVRGFTTQPDGSPRVIHGRSQQETFEVQIHPGPERLMFSEQDMGLGSGAQWASKAFMFEERSRRLHWVVAPGHGETDFVFVTHDPASGQTTRRAFALTSR